jgi:N-acetylneuraminic acid mutarotase
MIVWGGADGSSLLNTGGRYNPSTDTWTATSTINAPEGRTVHTAVWSGSEMIVWGGGGNNGSLNTGGRYNPSTDTWAATSTTNVPAARQFHTAVWSGSEMIVWGGSLNTGGSYNTGGRYNPRNNTWTATSTTNAPEARFWHTAIWTGTEMIIWGGLGGDVSGGRYNPSTDTWTATSTTNAPAARIVSTAIWTGTEMIVWGGLNNGSLNTGGRYNPSTDTWTATSTTNAPDGRTYHTAIWTGTEMILWGGSANSDVFNSGGRYCAQPSTPAVQSAVSRKVHGAAGSFNINLPLSGTPGIECRTGGTTNDHKIVVTFLANVSVTGNPQAQVTSGVATIGNSGVSNGGVVTTAGNLVTIPMTNVDDGQTINVILNGVNGSTNVVIPMSILVGDTNGSGSVNASDISQTKLQSGQQVTVPNFREDVNGNGAINASDLALVKTKSGTALP